MVSRFISLLLLSMTLTAVFPNSAKAILSCFKAHRRLQMTSQHMEAKRALRFHPPASVEVVSIPFEQPSVEKIQSLNPKDLKHLVDTQNLRASGARLLQSSGISKNVETVFYPFAGYDAISPKGLFPKAGTIVAVDASPFTRDITQTVEAEVYRIEVAGDFHTTGQSLEIRSVANALLARLFISDPDIRILRVAAMMEKGKSISGEGILTHGLIEYDRGSGTQLQRYVHIQADIGDGVLELWWYKQLQQFGFDAIILKAATGGFSSYSKLLDQDVLQNLIKNQAAFIDGDNMSHWEDQMRAAGAQTKPLHSFRGYGGGEVTFFSSQDPGS